VSARDPVARFAAGLPAVLSRDGDVARAWLEARPDGTRVLTVELDERPPDCETAARRVQSLVVRLHALFGMDAQGLGVAIGASADVGDPAPSAEVVYRRTAVP
jgi:hypothetical protein